MEGMPILEAMKALALALVVAAIPRAFPLEEGLASWYGGKFQGRVTASGEVFDTSRMTAAHKSLPFGTRVKVVNLDNGKSAVVKVNDRGPFVEGRVIDLSRAAAQQIDMVGTGTAKVSIEIVSFPPESCAIQVGAFAVEANAEKARDTLERAGFIVSFDPSTLGIVRVLVRGVPANEVASTRAALASLGFDRQLVRQEPSDDAGSNGH